MKDTANNLALGLGVAVLGFALYRYFRGQGAANAAAPSSSTPATVSGLTGASLTGGLPGSLASMLNFGGSTNGPTPLAVDNPYASTSWNPDALSAAMSQDLGAALQAANERGVNSYGFYLP
ncbi:MULTISPECIES: hypothetical protein [unclassified Burkholderia]|uniref:hypothetical protein n=1 Tax=unclassified Burkholderia TaxID=2613784 RepID=UPI000F593670|nr:MULTISPECIES: hypothetical protein [unclassified Burkholderia]RQS17495.1 hypothetical protein DIE05_37415 [Burkholderia sp. Bp8995]RQS37902.1 hypothetical protein DIE00_37290 [Burkholderia sp. Bp8989]